jgi:hypothetical protein
MSLSSPSLEVGSVSSSPLEPPREAPRKSEPVALERENNPRVAMQPPAPPARVTLRRPARRELPLSPLVGLLAPGAGVARPPAPVPSRSEGWRDATESHAAWSALLGELCAPDVSLVLVAELEDGTTTLWPRPAEAARPRARSAQLAVKGGTRWRVRLDAGGEEVASLAERAALLRSALSEVRRAVCWRAKDALVALRLGPTPAEGCRGLCDPQVGLWLLDSADEHLPWDEALRRCGVPRLLDPHEQQVVIAFFVLICLIASIGSTGD